MRKSASSPHTEKVRDHRNRNPFKHQEHRKTPTHHVAAVVALNSILEIEALSAQRGIKPATTVERKDTLAIRADRIFCLGDI